MKRSCEILGIATLASMVACGGNTPPTIEAIDDQQVLRNTLAPRSLELELQLHDPDDARLMVTVTSDDESVVPATSFPCDRGACPLVLVPSPERTAEVTVTVAVSDERGGVATTDFALTVVPRLVTQSGDTGLGSLRNVIFNAEDGDVIEFAGEGDFRRSIELRSQLMVDKTVTIEGRIGQSGSELVTIGGGNLVRLLRVSGAADVVVRGLRLQEGRAAPEAISVGGQTRTLAVGGAALVESGATLTLDQCRVMSSEAKDLGGAIAVLGGTLVVSGDTIMSGNASELGGGIAALRVGPHEAVVVVEDSRIISNDGTAAGGGLYASQSSIALTGARIGGNEAPMGGGVLMEAGSQLVASESAIVGNRASEEGAGLSVHGSTVRFTGGVIGDNRLTTAAGRGGGVYNAGEVVLAGDARLEENSATRDGGGVYNDGGARFTLEAPGGGAAGAAIAANRAGRFGGGVLNADGATLILEQDTRITDNVAESTGGGVLNHGTLQNQGTVSGNTPEDIADGVL